MIFKMNYCPECGEELVEDANYCHKCGRKAELSPSPEEEKPDSDNPNNGEDGNDLTREDYRRILEEEMEKARKED